MKLTGFRVDYLAHQRHLAVVVGRGGGPGHFVGEMVAQFLPIVQITE
jgi:hypothetical protein